jgi:hypothetical protein
MSHGQKRESAVGNKIMVYSYWTWVPGEGLGQIPLAKLPRRQIEAVGGLAILLSGEEVDEDDLCRDGAYWPQRCARMTDQPLNPA